MTNVYSWPPVATMSKEWSINDPISESIELFSGDTFVSAAQRRRRIAKIQASSIFSPYAAGAGYMEALKRLLKGGVHLVRLNHRTRVYYEGLIPENIRVSNYIGWIYPSQSFDWESNGSPFIWFSGIKFNAVVIPDAPIPSFTVSGLPPNALIAIPGQFASGHRVNFSYVNLMIIAPVKSDSDGNAVVRFEFMPSDVVTISFGAIDTGVFKANSMPRAVEPAGQDWSYTWDFTEVFEDERGPFVEINPWN